MTSTHLAIIDNLKMSPHLTDTSTRVLLRITLMLPLSRLAVRPVSDDPHGRIIARRPFAFPLPSRSFVFARHLHFHNGVPEDEGRFLPLTSTLSSVGPRAIQPDVNLDLDPDRPYNPSNLGQPINPLSDRFHPTGDLEDLYIQRNPVYSFLALPGGSIRHLVVIKVRRYLLHRVVVVVVVVFPGDGGEVPDTGGGESEDFVYGVQVR